jgi:hypothetical protein
MPYPAHGLEFSDGLAGHLRLGVHIWGDDMWVKDEVDLYVREVRQVATSFDTLAWREDSEWQYVASWPRDVALSADGSEGVGTLNLVLT